jgi:hypothetical protein
MDEKSHRRLAFIATRIPFLYPVHSLSRILLPLSAASLAFLSPRLRSASISSIQSLHATANRRCDFNARLPLRRLVLFMAVREFRRYAALSSEPQCLLDSYTAFAKPAGVSLRLSARSPLGGMSHIAWVTPGGAAEWSG